MEIVGEGAHTISACFLAAWSKPLKESFKHSASWLRESGFGCQSMAPAQVSEAASGFGAFADV